MNEKDKLSDVKEVTELLLRLRPARSELDSRVVFYEAGYNAALNELGHNNQSSVWYRTGWNAIPIIAAGLLVALLTVPTSFHFGRQAATQPPSRIRVPEASPAQSDSIDAPRERGTESDFAPTPIGPNAEQVAMRNPDMQSPGSQGSDALARWLDPLVLMSGATDDALQADATMTAADWSSVSVDRADGDWLDIPVSATLAAYRESMVVRPDVAAQSLSPLAVGDFQQIAHSLEAVR